MSEPIGMNRSLSTNAPANIIAKRDSTIKKDQKEAEVLRARGIELGKEGIKLGEEAKLMIANIIQMKALEVRIHKQIQNIKKLDKQTEPPDQKYIDRLAKESKAIKKEMQPFIIKNEIKK